jgi:hypothetical protein
MKIDSGKFRTNIHECIPFWLGSGRAQLVETGI